MKDVWHLRRIDWLREFTSGEREALQQASGANDYGPGEMVFSPEPNPNSVYLLETGLVRIFRLSTAGSETTFGYVAPGEVFGELAGFGDYPRESFAQTVRKSRAWKVPRATFQEVIANIRQHPSFHMGPAGFGDEGVIPWDFSHASEQSPTTGTLPMLGAPSQGWSSDAQVRNGADGKAELWFLTKFGEPARGYVLSGQYKWASVALSFQSVDNVTGANTGAVVTSVALTNRPFIEGMAQLAAENTGASSTPPDNAVEAAQTAKENAMEILKVLAALLNVAATQEAVTAELENLKGLRDELVALFAMVPNKATTTAILQNAVDSHKGAETLFALCGALAVKTGSEAITSVAALQAASAELEKMKPELVALQAVQAATEAAEAKVDVDRALASNSAFDESMRPMFALSRTTDKAAFLAQYPVPEAGAVAAPAGAAHLTQSVAATTAGVQLAVQPTVGAAAVTIDSQGNMQRPAPVQAAMPVAATGVLGGVQVNLAVYPGVTETQKMVAHLCASRAGFKDQTWDDQFEAACLALAELKKTAA